MTARMQPIDPISPRSIDNVVATTENAFAHLSPPRIIEGIVRAVHTLRTNVQGDATALLCKSTGLTEPMIEWALQTSCDAFSEHALWEIRQRAYEPISQGSHGMADPIATPPATCTVVVLSANVFTACLPALLIPLALGSTVIAKASSRDDALPRLLRAALTQVDPDLGRAFAVVTFVGGEEELERALFRHATTVVAYGSDHTLECIQERLSALPNEAHPPNQSPPSRPKFVPHGHGFGVIYIPAASLPNERAARDVAQSVALDIAAYDQRGCLSPHAAWVEEGGGVSPRRFAELLATESLPEIARTLPRGPLPLTSGAQQLQWRAVAQARGELFEGDGYSVEYASDRPFRLSPGYRNVAVHSVRNAEEAASIFESFGRFLKCLGIAGSHQTVPPLPGHPFRTAVGTMQTPPLDR